MDDHASSTRRQFFASAAAAGVGVSVALAVHELASADDLDGVDGAATATERAVRTRLTDTLSFPVEVGDGLIVLNNFLGRSVSSGACNHLGIDIFPTTAATRNLLSCVDGVIDGQRINAGSQGNAWILRDADGVKYRYHHIDTFAEGLDVGSQVVRGQPIATMGTSGNANSPHLHFEVRLDGSSASAVNPVPLMVFPIPGVTLGPYTGCG